MISRRLGLFLALIMVFGSMIAAVAQQPDSEPESQMQFRFVGPRVGNRISAVGATPRPTTTHRRGTRAARCSCPVAGTTARGPNAQRRRTRR